MQKQSFIRMIYISGLSQHKSGEGFSSCEIYALHTYNSGFHCWYLSSCWIPSGGYVCVLGSAGMGRDQRWHVRSCTASDKDPGVCHGGDRA